MALRTSVFVAQSLTSLTSDYQLIVARRTAEFNKIAFGHYTHSTRRTLVCHQITIRRLFMLVVEIFIGYVLVAVSSILD